MTMARNDSGNYSQSTNDDLCCESDLSARDNKELMASSEFISDERNGSPTTWSDDESDWRTSLTEILSLKQSMNHECSNSVPINFTDAWSYFRCNYLSQNVDTSVQQLRSSFQTGSKFRNVIFELMGQPALKPSQLQEKSLILEIASSPMNNECHMHRRILQSIYVFMTKNSSCPRYGCHWEDVGFQGQDPASDLRAVGMFGALQMLYLSSSQETKETLSPDVYDLSRHPVHKFPLAVLSLNVTKMALDAFRDGLLNRFCNKENSAIVIVNRFYLAILCRIYQKWSEKGMTLHDSCYLLKAVEKCSRANPKKTFTKLDEYLGRPGSINRKKGESKRSGNVNSTLKSSWSDLTKAAVEVFI